MNSLTRPQAHNDDEVITAAVNIRTEAGSSMADDRLTITLGSELREKLKALANRDKRPMAFIVRQALEDFVRDKEFPGEQISILFDHRPK